MDYLEAVLLRFQRLIWCIWGFCISLGCGDIIKGVKNAMFGNLPLCKKKTHQMARSKNRRFEIYGDSKKSLKTGIIEFYKLNSSKGKAYTF